MANEKKLTKEQRNRDNNAIDEVTKKPMSILRAEIIVKNTSKWPNEVAALIERVLRKFVVKEKYFFIRSTMNNDPNKELMNEEPLQNGMKPRQPAGKPLVWHNSAHQSNSRHRR